ncbi:type II toxin-antitoxin system RelE family toxin [Specibacter cremeus]|uniref:type II toxin-antitoxin system RelE family toxin n=1 Tax=Specibacter cremeus TaxID=1629051 RepID=UPI000F79B3ED|nr:type II toxin-antitoxin system RelE/ParE family toxin [Specibacter cremeus]
MTPRWHVETTEQFDRDFRKLDRPVQRRIATYLEEVQLLESPRTRGKGLTANHAGVWRYRVGDYRVLAQIMDETLTILALHVAHRSQVY